MENNIFKKIISFSLIFLFIFFIIYLFNNKLIKKIKINIKNKNDQILILEEQNRKMLDLIDFLKKSNEVALKNIEKEKEKQEEILNDFKKLNDKYNNLLISYKNLSKIEQDKLLIDILKKNNIICKIKSDENIIEIDSLNRFKLLEFTLKSEKLYNDNLLYKNLLDSKEKENNELNKVIVNLQDTIYLKDFYLENLNKEISLFKETQINYSKQIASLNKKNNFLKVITTVAVGATIYIYLKYKK